MIAKLFRCSVIQLPRGSPVNVFDVDTNDPLGNVQFAVQPVITDNAGSGSDTFKKNADGSYTSNNTTGDSYAIVRLTFNLQQAMHLYIDMQFDMVCEWVVAGVSEANGTLHHDCSFGDEDFYYIDTIDPKAYTFDVGVVPAGVTSYEVKYIRCDTSSDPDTKLTFTPRLVGDSTTITTGADGQIIKTGLPFAENQFILQPYNEYYIVRVDGDGTYKTFPDSKEGFSVTLSESASSRIVNVYMRNGANKALTVNTLLKRTNMTDI